MDSTGVCWTAWPRKGYQCCAISQLRAAAVWLHQLGTIANGLHGIHIVQMVEGHPACMLGGQQYKEQNMNGQMQWPLSQGKTATGRLIRMF